MPRTPKPKLRIPHTFVLEALAPLSPEVRRMFSGFAAYVGDRLVLVARPHQVSEGQWYLAVLAEGVDPADASLRRDFPSIRSIQLLRNKISHLLLIPSDSADFDRAAVDACDLILSHDPRLGRIPRSRR